MSLLAGWTLSNRIALAAAALSAALCGTVVADARRLDALPRRAEPEAMEPMPRIALPPRDDAGVRVLAAVSRDPFRPDRRRPPGRYRLPGEALPPAAMPAYAAPAYTAPAPSYSFRALGTVILPDGSGLAAVAGQSGEGRVLRVGQSIEGFRVVRVAPGVVTLEGSDTTLVLRTPDGGAQ
ncbi:MAG TPA: hypothetical protein VEQ60_03825 [Longimicrobium sp.]|nr:hypothetical protein [Longimicrobium sp.]